MFYVDRCEYTHSRDTRAGLDFPTTYAAQLGSDVVVREARLDESKAPTVQRFVDALTKVSKQVVKGLSSGI